jgi:hypothetical protein
VVVRASKNEGPDPMNTTFSARGSDETRAADRIVNAHGVPARAKLGLAAACVLNLPACVTPQERHAMDGGQCDAFGFERGTDAFAQCMMDLHQQRALTQASRDPSWQSHVAERARRGEAQQDLYKQMSLQRSGDTRFPVCGAASDGGMDRRTMTWFGPNCRAR